VFEGLPSKFEVARYHSLYGNKASFPADLRVTALTEDGVIMAIEHKSLPLAAVQFHPESILTNPSYGLRMLANAVKNLVYEKD
jgi:anthranilate synthase